MSANISPARLEDNNPGCIYKEPAMTRQLLILISASLISLSPLAQASSSHSTLASKTTTNSIQPALKSRGQVSWSQQNGVIRENWDLHATGQNTIKQTPPTLTDDIFYNYA